MLRSDFASIRYNAVFFPIQFRTSPSIVSNSTQSQNPSNHPKASSGFLTVCLDRDNRILHANAAMRNLVGRPLEDLIGQPPQLAWLEEILPDKDGNQGKVQTCRILTANQRISSAKIHLTYLDPESLTRIVNYQMAPDSNTESDSALGLEWGNLEISELKAIMGALASLLEVDYVFLGECTPSQDDQVRIRLMWEKGHYRDFLTYPLAGTPCEKAIYRDCYYSPEETWQKFPDDPLLEEMQIACYLGIPLLNQEHSPIGHLGIMHTNPKPSVWAGPQLLSRFAKRVGILLEKTSKREKDAREFGYLYGLKKLTQQLDQVTTLSAMAEMVVRRVSRIFKSDHTWMVRLPHDAPSSGWQWAEHCSEPHKKLFPHGEQPEKTLEIDAWNELFSMASKTNHTLQIRPPHTGETSGSSATPLYWVICLKPRTGPEWLLGMLPNPFLVKAELTRDKAKFEEIAAKINASLSQLILFLALEASHSRYKNLVETIGEIIFLTDASFNIQWLNPAWQRITGWPIEDGLGRYLGAFFRAQDFQECQAALDAVEAPLEEAITWNLQLRTSTDQEKWIRASITPFFGPDGKRQGLSGILEDITLQKNIEFDLRQSEQHFRALVEQTPRVAVQGYDEDLNILAWNGPSQEIFGYSAEEAIGRNLLDLILSEPAAESWKKGLRSWLDEDESLHPGEMTLRHKSGRPVHIYASHTLLPNAEGEPEFYTTSVDLTEHKQTEAALKASETRYRSLVELSPQAIFVVADMRIVFANLSALRLLGATAPRELLNQKFSGLVPPSQAEALTDALTDLAKRQDCAPLPIDLDNYRLFRKDHQQIDVEMIAIPVAYAGGPAIQLIVHDVTQRKRAEEALRHSEARYALAALGANDGLWDWDLKTDRIYYSPRWQSMLGFYANTSNQTPAFWLDRVHPDDLPGLKRQMEAHLSQRIDQFENEHRLMHVDGEYRWMHCRGVAVFDEVGQPKRMAGSLRDITERKKVEHQLFHDAFHDSLTGLANRALFMEHLKRALRKDQKEIIAIIFIDCDRFKLVNDSLGHLIGDKLLMAVAERLDALLPARDLFARLGGDEFAVLIEGHQAAEQAILRADTIHQHLVKPFNIDKNQLYTSVSIGISFGEPGRDKPVDVLRDADTAMYRAKARGKAQSVVFDQAMHKEVQRLMTLENDLHKAMDHDEFIIYFQPIFDLRSLKLAGFEALLRWNHPTNGLIAPDIFIGLAEETGIILPLGLKVLRLACQHMDAIHQIGGPDLFLHVNLSFRQIMEADLKNEIETVLNQTQFPANRLKLELTESVVAQPGETAIQLLHDLRELGILLCLDDFGTGYASLSYLHRLPIDSLKIDKSFTDQLLKEKDDKALVPTIINLAHNLGLSVVAEGVESNHQFRRLLDLGCEYAQGYYFGKPVSAGEAKTLCEQLKSSGLNLPGPP